jgi:hypothetical protein
LGLVVALSVIGTAAVIGFPASADELDDTTTDTTVTTTIGVSALETSSTTASTTTASSSTTTTSTTSTTTTTTTTTTLPPMFDRPVVASRPSQRSTRQLQLVTPPPAPTTTTTTTLPPLDQLPANSGTGRRVVYSKTNQWVWTVEADGVISKSHPVSGRRTWNQPLPGEYSVFSRSLNTCNIKKPYLCWRYMVRFTVGPEGDNIGFHEIPLDTRYDPPRPVQDISQLGTALSNGCVRQATPDAVHIWNWAPVGTKVVVLP